MRLANAAEQWERVPAFVERIPSHTSHGLCPLCFDYHYPAEPKHVRAH